MMLQKVGARAVVLHSILKQKQRFSSLEQFKSHKARILVATDVASRGLDLPNVAIVVNHNVPGAPRNYVHRVGRTARAGRKGLSITMVSPYDTGTKMVISRVVTRFETKKAYQILTKNLATGLIIPRVDLNCFSYYKYGINRIPRTRFGN